LESKCTTAAAAAAAAAAANDEMISLLRMQGGRVNDLDDVIVKLSTTMTTTLQCTEYLLAASSG